MPVRTTDPWKITSTVPSATVLAWNFFAIFTFQYLNIDFNNTRSVRESKSNGKMVSQWWTGWAIQSIATFNAQHFQNLDLSRRMPIGKAFHAILAIATNPLSHTISTNFSIIFNIYYPSTFLLHGLLYHCRHLQFDRFFSGMSIGRVCACVFVGVRFEFRMSGF